MQKELEKKCLLFFLRVLACWINLSVVSCNSGCLGYEYHNKTLHILDLVFIIHCFLEKEKKSIQLNITKIYDVLSCTPYTMHYNRILVTA